MSQPMIVRVLQVVAVALGIAIVGLGTAWLREDPIEPMTGAEGAREPAPDAAHPRASEVATSEAALKRGAEGAAVGATDRRESAHPADDRAVLYGSILDADGEPVKQGVLWVWRQRDGKHVGTCSLRDGSFVFPGLTPGEHRLKSRITDELPLDRMIAVSAPLTRIDLTLAPRWQLTVHAVTSDGSPVVEAVAARATGSRWDGALSAYATREPLGGDLPPSHQSEVEGGLGAFRANDVFSDDVLPKTAVGVLALPPDQPVSVALLMRNVIVAQQQAAPGQDELTFRLSADDVLAKTATVRMRVVDETGAPVPEARVSMTDAQTGSSGMPTDADGRIVLEHLAPGRLDLSVRHRTLGAPPVLIDVPGGAVLDLGDVTLRPTVRVAFSFEEFDGEGSVRAYWLDALPDPGWHVDERHLSASNGRLMHYGLFPGRWFLRAQSGDRIAHMTLDTSTVGAEPLRFRFDDGAPLRVRGDVGELPRRFTITTSSGGLVHSSEVSGAVDRRFTLPVGDYVAELVGGGAPIRRGIALRPGGAELRLP